MTCQPLAEGQLYALMYPHELDGCRSTHPLHARGVVTLNSYVAVAEDRAVIIDVGFSFDEAAMVADLDPILAGRRLSIWATRIAEFNSICNIRPLIDRFDVDILYGAQYNSPAWVDFRPGFDPAASAVAGVDSEVIRTGNRVRVDGAGERELIALPAPLVLLPTNRIYDAQTRTLITGDAFSDVWSQDASGSCLVTDIDEPITAEDV